MWAFILACVLILALIVNWKWQKPVTQEELDIPMWKRPRSPGTFSEHLAYSVAGIGIGLLIAWAVIL